jgi:putative ABC transport system permease protein
MLGVVIGVAAVVSLLSIGQSASASVTGQIEGAGANTVNVMMRGRDASYTLTISDVEMFETLNHIVAVAPQNTIPATVEAGSESVDVSITATTEAYAAVNVLGMAQGRFLSASDQENLERVAVLG